MGFDSIILHKVAHFRIFCSLSSIWHWFLCCISVWSCAADAFIMVLPLKTMEQIKSSSMHQFCVSFSGVKLWKWPLCDSVYWYEQKWWIHRLLVKVYPQIILICTQLVYNGAIEILLCDACTAKSEKCMNEQWHYWGHVFTQPPGVQHVEVGKC